MSFFSLGSNKKRRVLQNLRDAIVGIEDGHVEILEEVMLNAHADGMGFTKHGKQHDSMFFGFEYVLRKLPQPDVKPVAQSKTVAQPVQPPITGQHDDATSRSRIDSLAKAVAEAELVTPQHRATNSQIERMKVGGIYTCPKCNKFTTNKPIGMKKHYNKCGLP